VTEVVRAERFVLRPFEEGDRAEYVRMHEVSAEHFRPWFPASDGRRSIEDRFQEEVTRARQGLEAGTEVRLAAFDADGALLGTFSLSQIFRRAFLNAYAGWAVSAEHVGRGIATEGVTALLDLAFAPEPLGLGLHRVQANIIPSNGASVRVAEKAGFRLEGCAKEYLKIDGRWQDHLMYAKLADEHRQRFPTPVS
jgi:ribosomal-protein-alanine N-acetyltransferase